MSREALVVGINTYQQLPSLNASAGDAEAIAQLLEKHGDFRVHRLPAFQDPFDNHAPRVARNQGVSLVELEDALVHLFKPDSRSIPDTAVFFFSGHGLRKQRGIQEGFLATSDSQADQGFFGLSLQWLRRLLQESEVRQQVIWLDCCHSGELLQFEEADPGDRGKGRDRCFIAASRSHQPAYESTGGSHSLLTQALLEGLNPNRFPDRGIDNLLLTDYVNQSLRGALQSPVCTNSGEPIRLSYRQTALPAVAPKALEAGDRCPYKGLAYFDCNDEDPKYFYGRTALVDSLLDQVRQTSFLALLGASGSGKSSVLRAGLLHQLKRGQRLSGSDQWNVHVLTPGVHPLQNLALALLDPALTGIDRATQLNQIEHLLAQGGTGMRQIAQSCGAPRMVVVVDQMEEVFTLCQDAAERDAFFACLLEPLGAATQESHCPLLVLLALRADFFSPCMEQSYSGLGDRLRHHLVPIPPMNRDELRDAILQPAKQVGLEIEPELVATMLVDLEGAPGHLPLLQYTLTELWKRRQDNCLTLYTYTRLGGILGTLRQRADAVYGALSDREKATARNIFLSLTQINEGAEDTRRRVPKSDLITPQHPSEVVNTVLQRLTAEQLVVTNELVGKGDGRADARIAVVDVAHEALIRHWPLLRSWIAENRNLLSLRQKLEAKAEEWQTHKCSPDYLLRGKPLQEAKDFQSQHGKSFPLSNQSQTFIQKSLGQKRRGRLIRAGVAVGFGLAIAPFVITWIPAIVPTMIAPLVLHQRGKQAFVYFFAGPDQTTFLLDGAGSLKRWNAQQQSLDTLLTMKRPGWRTYPIYPLLSDTTISADEATMAILGPQGIYFWQANQPTIVVPEKSQANADSSAEEFNQYHPYGGIVAVALSPDGTQVVYRTSRNEVYLWNREGEILTTLQEAEGFATDYPMPYAPTIVFSPDGQLIAAIAADTLHLWDREGNLISSPSEAPTATPSTGLKYLRFSPDGQRLVTSISGTVELWDRQGRRLRRLVTADNRGWGGLPAVFTFSRDGKTLVTVADSTVTVWSAEDGQMLNTAAMPEPSEDMPNYAAADTRPAFLRFSPDGQVIAWMRNDKIWLWRFTGEAIATLSAQNLPPPPAGWGTPTTPGFIGFDFHPTESLLVTAQFDGYVQLWDFQGQAIQTLQPGVPLPPPPASNPSPLNPRNWIPPENSTISPTFGTRQVQFQPDGEAIALIQNGALRLIDLEGRELLEMRPNGKPES